jgi:hypothetical protein
VRRRAPPQSKPGSAHSQLSVDLKRALEERDEELAVALETNQRLMIS